MGREEADRKLNYLRTRLKPQGHKVGTQDPLLSVIEGMISRGDERVGLVLEEACLMGSRLDSWNEYLKRDVWEGLLLKYNDLINEILTGMVDSGDFPWACIDSGVPPRYFEKEFEKSHAGEATSACMKNCKQPCGICSEYTEIVQNDIQLKALSNENMVTITNLGVKQDPNTYRIVFSFAKSGNAVFHPHLCLLEIFSMAFIRADLPILYTRGFNPLPHLEIASPLSLGLAARGEIAAIDTECYCDAEKFKTALNTVLPDGLEVIEAMNVFIPSGGKKHSLASLLWGYVYAGSDGKPETVEAKNEKSYREFRVGQIGSVYYLERLSVLSRPDVMHESNIALPHGESYFKVYRALYPETDTSRSFQKF